MSVVDVSAITLTTTDDVLTLGLGDASLKVKLPRGERGLPGRDGLSVRGERGPPGEKGERGLDGRDSIVPGPKGEEGCRGLIGRTPQFQIGSVIVGETANVILSGDLDAPILNFVIPRGERGPVGVRGQDGRHGTHEKVALYHAGSSPRWSRDFISSHVLADGIIDIPVMTELDCGSWIYFRTFDVLAIAGLVEGVKRLDKEGCKFVVVPYNNQYLFTAF